MIQASRTLFMASLATLILVAAIHGQEQRGGPGGPLGGSTAGAPRGAGFGALPTATSPKPLIPNAKPVRSCESQATGVTRSRPLCQYPLVAKYKGTGSTDDAANFVCSIGFSALPWGSLLPPCGFAAGHRLALRRKQACALQNQMSNSEKSLSRRSIDET